MIILNPSVKVGAYFRPQRGFPTPQPIASYRTYDKTNDDPDKMILKDRTGNGHDLKLENFSYNFGSGWGIYNLDFTSSENPYNYEVTPRRISFNSPEYGYVTCKVPNHNSIYFKLRVSGLEPGEAISIRAIADSSAEILDTQTYRENKEYFYIFESSENFYLAVYNSASQRAATGTDTGTIEQIPDYNGGLVFDGIDDQAVCRNFPILENNRGYTVIALRKWLSVPSAKDAVLMGNYGGVNDMTFVLETYYSNVDEFHTNSFSYYSPGETVIPYVFNSSDIFVYQTSNNYNGMTIKKGDVSIGANTFILGNIYPDSTLYSNVVIWAVEVYNRDLKDYEIEYAKRKLLKEWYKKAFDSRAITYQNLWTCNGKSNLDLDKNIPNLIDNTNPLVLNNFAFEGDSGYKEGSLYLDGVDDYFSSSKSVPATDSDYTVIADFDSSLATKDVGVAKQFNWGWNKDSLYINTTVRKNLITNKKVLGFNSRGFIVTQDSVMEGIVGTDIPSSYPITSRATGYGLMRFNSLAIVPEILNEEQIRQTYNYLKTVKANNTEKLLPFDPTDINEYQALWTCKDKTNDDTNKNIPNLVDTTNPLIPYNFAWGGASGYGSYPYDFKLMQGRKFTKVTKTHNKLTITQLGLYTEEEPQVLDYMGGILNSYPEMTFTVSGLKEGASIKFALWGNLIVNKVLLTVTENGTFTLPAESTNPDRSYLVVIVEGYTPEAYVNISITEQAIQEGSLHFDGVDDRLESSKNLTTPQEYTIVGNFENMYTTTDIVKILSWYWSDSKIIMDSNQTGTSIPEGETVLGFTSKGLIVTNTQTLLDTNQYDYYLPNESLVSLSNSNVSNPFIFKSLAIIPRVLTEEEIRATYEHLKTI